MADLSSIQHESSKCYGLVPFCLRVLFGARLVQAFTSDVYEIRVCDWRVLDPSCAYTCNKDR